MKMHTIEIDEKIWHYLQQYAEPFVDTPNSVLTKLLFGEDDGKEDDKEEDLCLSEAVAGTGAKNK